MLKYQFKTTWTSAHWAAILFAALTPVIFAPAMAHTAEGSVLQSRHVLDVCQTFLSLVGILTMGGLLAREFESNTAETLLSTPYSRLHLLLARCLLATGYTVTIILAVLLANQVLGRLSGVYLLQGLIASGTTAIYLGSLAMMFGGITGSGAAGILISASYWLLDFYTKGQYSGLLYLFSFGDSRFSGKETELVYGINWAVNKSLLLLSAMMLVAITLIWFNRKHVA